MGIHRHSLFALAFAFAILSATCAAADLQTKKLNVLVSGSETESGAGSDWTLTWNLNGEWERPGKNALLNITVDSDYAKSSHSKLDRLRTAFRVMHKEYGKKSGKWYPVFLLQTEGDHGGDSIHTLAAAGYRQHWKHGYVELTAGASKDIRTNESWLVDVGTQFGYERRWGKWKFSTGPKGEVSTIGDVRVRGDRVRYSWDASLDYQVNKHIGIGYRLWAGNTVPNATRTQWIGLTYKLK